MKLSDLVKYRNRLQDFDLQSAIDAVHQHTDSIVYDVQHADRITPYDQDTLNAHQEIIDQIKDFGQNLEKVQSHVQSLIDQQNTEYFVKSYHAYEALRGASKDPNFLDRRLNLDPDSYNIIEARIALVADWHYPGLVIHPGLENWVDRMVSMDPLYVMDEDWDWLEPLKQRYSENYQRRVRYFVTPTFSEGARLDLVPNEQLGLILCFYFFNFKPFEVVKQYLQEAYQKLRPGGICMFTINDCDRPGAVDLVDRYYAAYTPARLVISYAESLGFECRFQHNINEAVTWIELIRPGTLLSLRGGQSLSKIIA